MSFLLTETVEYFGLLKSIIFAQTQLFPFYEGQKNFCKAVFSEIRPVIFCLNFKNYFHLRGIAEILHLELES